MEKNTVNEEMKHLNFQYHAGRYHGILTALDAIMDVREREKDFISVLTAKQILDEIYDALTCLETEEKEEYLESKKAIQ